MRDEEKAVEVAAAPRGTSACPGAAPAAQRGTVRCLECQTDVSFPALYDVTFSLAPALPGAGGGAGVLSKDNVLAECVSRGELDEKLEKLAAACTGDLAAGARETLTAAGALVHSATQQAIDQALSSLPLAFNENLSNAVRVPLSKMRDELFAVVADLEHKVAVLEKRLVEFVVPAPPCSAGEALAAFDARAGNSRERLLRCLGGYQRVPVRLTELKAAALNGAIGFAGAFNEDETRVQVKTLHDGETRLFKIENLMEYEICATCLEEVVLSEFPPCGCTEEDPVLRSPVAASMGSGATCKSYSDAAAGPRA